MQGPIEGYINKIDEPSHQKGFGNMILLGRKKSEKLDGNFYLRQPSTEEQTM